MPHELHWAWPSRSRIAFALNVRTAIQAIRCCTLNVPTITKAQLGIVGAIHQSLIGKWEGFINGF